MPARISFHCILVLFAFVVAVHDARATSVIPPSFNSLVGQADYVVRTVVKSVNAQLYVGGAHRHIKTKVELEVLEVISGTPPQPLVLQLLGGKVGDEEMVVDGTPKFKVGDEDILFVHANGRQFCPLVALLHGRYPIKQDGKTGRRYVARGDGTPLADEKEISRPLLAGDNRAAQAPVISAASSALTPSDFVTRIKALALENLKSNQVQP